MSIYEAGESFVETLIMNLEGLLSPFKNILTTANYDVLVSIVTAEVTARLEKVVLKSTYNRVSQIYIILIMLLFYMQHSGLYKA